MSSVVDICNSALYKIGASRISTLTEQNKAARICNDIFAKIRDEVLRAHPWNFATKRIQLAREVDTPTFGYSYQYALPTDCLRVLGVSGDSNLGTSVHIAHKIEGRKLLTNEETVFIKYIFRETNTGNYEANFVEALAFRLAQELAYPMVQSADLTDKMKKNYREWIADARTFDAQEGTPEDVIDDVFLNARFYGGLYDETMWRETR